jgi:hypothetical protein
MRNTNIKQIKMQHKLIAKAVRLKSIDKSVWQGRLSLNFFLIKFLN